MTGYCSTLVAQGPGLPREAQGGCGTILVVNGGVVGRGVVGGVWWGVLVFVLSCLVGALGL